MFARSIECFGAVSRLVVGTQPTHIREAFDRWEKHFTSMNTGCCSTRACIPLREELGVLVTSGFTLVICTPHSRLGERGGDAAPPFCTCGPVWVTPSKSQPRTGHNARTRNETAEQRTEKPANHSRTLANPRQTDREPVRERRSTRPGGGQITTSHQPSSSAARTFTRGKAAHRKRTQAKGHGRTVRTPGESLQASRGACAAQ